MTACEEMLAKQIVKGGNPTSIFISEERLICMLCNIIREQQETITKLQESCYKTKIQDR